MTDYAFTLSKYYPEAVWSMDGDEYSGLNWRDESPKPTQEELDAHYQDYVENSKYKDDRQRAYIERGLTLEARLVAILDLFERDDRTALNNVIRIRDEVDALYPAPNPASEKEI